MLPWNMSTWNIVVKSADLIPYLANIPQIIIAANSGVLLNAVVRYFLAVYFCHRLDKHSYPTKAPEFVYIQEFSIKWTFKSYNCQWATPIIYTYYAVEFKSLIYQPYCSAKVECKFDCILENSCCTFVCLHSTCFCFPALKHLTRLMESLIIAC